jgi:hypothetical protein
MGVPAKKTLFILKTILTSGGCQTIIASGYLVTFYVKPDVKKHKNRTLTGSNPPVFKTHCFNIFVLFDLSEVVFCSIFYPARMAGLLLFDLRCRSGKIHNKYLHSSFVFIG